MRKTFTKSISAHNCQLAFPSSQNVLCSTSCSSRPRSAPSWPSYALVICAPVPTAHSTSELQGNKRRRCSSVKRCTAHVRLGRLGW